MSTRETRSTFWQFVKGLALAGVTASVLLGSWLVYDIHVRHRLGTVALGKVYQSGVIPPDELQKVARDLHLKSVIDLRTFVVGQDTTNTTSLATIQKETRALADIGVRHIHLPTPQVPSDATVDAFLQAMIDPENLPTLIHCYHGIGRTELFVAIYRMEFQHWSNERARSATRFLLAGSSFSDRAEKGRYLIAYRNRLPNPLGAIATR